MYCSEDRVGSEKGKCWQQVEWCSVNLNHFTLILCQSVSQSVSQSVLVSTPPVNPSAWRHLNPSSYCDVGRLFYGVFKLWSKLQRKK